MKRYDIEQISEDWARDKYKLDLERLAMNASGWIEYAENNRGTQYTALRTALASLNRFVTYILDDGKDEELKNIKNLLNKISKVVYEGGEFLSKIDDYDYRFKIKFSGDKIYIYDYYNVIRLLRYIFDRANYIRFEKGFGPLKARRRKYGLDSILESEGVSEEELKKI